MALPKIIGNHYSYVNRLKKPEKAEEDEQPPKVRDRGRIPLGDVSSASKDKILRGFLSDEDITNIQRWFAQLNLNQGFCEESDAKTMFKIEKELKRRGVE